MITKQILALMVSLAIGAFSAFSQPMNNSSSKNPDFAFPDKVAKDADLRLDKALSDGNAQEVVNSLVCYSLAKNAISPTLLPPVLQRIDSIKIIEKDPCVKSILSYLQAKIYFDIYSSDRWNYDRREIPENITISDYTQWDGKKFKTIIAGLLKDACSPIDILAASPVKDWGKIITGDEYTYQCYPTLFDFIAYNSIDIYNSIAQGNAVLPMRYFQTDLLINPLPAIAMVDNFSRDAHHLCIKLIKLHRGHPASEITARIKAIRTIANLIYFQEDSNNSEQSAFLSLYDEFAGSEWSCEALLAYPANLDDRKYINLLRKVDKEFPNYMRINAIKQKIEYAEQKQVEFNSPRFATPGKPFEVKVTLQNLEQVTINVYRSSQPMTEYPKSLDITQNILSNLTYKHIVTTIPQEKPYKAEAKAVITLDRPGYYYVCASFEGQEKETRLRVFDVITCSNIAPLAFGLDGKIYPYAVDSYNGSPLSGITISSKNNNEKIFKPIGTSDNNGTIKDGIFNARALMLSKGSEAVLFDAPWVSNRHDLKSSVEATVFTSLPIYHHGDSVEWSIVSYISENGKNRVNSGARLYVSLSDVNNQEVATDTVLTDATGRAVGKFSLPEEGLSGNYRFIIKDNESAVGYGAIMVNDYKLPTFEAEVTNVKRCNAPDSLICITCKAESFSGFPVAGANVKVRLEAVNQIFWRSAVRGITFWTEEMTTEKDGTLTVNINDKILALNPIFNSKLNITFDITSAAGETRSCSRLISTGKPYTIIAPSFTLINLDKNPALNVEVIDADNQKVSIPLKYTFIKDSIDIASFKTGDAFPTNIPVGYYDISITPEDETLADSIVTRHILLYKNTGPSPTMQVLFIPVQQFTASEDNVSVLLGCSCHNVNVLVTTSVDGKMHSREWFRPLKGMQEFKVNVPENSHEIEIMFSTIHDNNLQVERVKIINGRIKRELAIETESFRDKIVPGTPEKITIKVKENGTGVQASVIMRMESKSILALRPNPLSLNIPAMRYGTTSIKLRNNNIYGSLSAPVKNLSWPSIPLPSLQTYGLDFSSYAHRKLRNFKSVALRGASAAREDATEEMAVVSDEAVAYDAAAPMLAENKVTTVNGAITGGVEITEEEEIADEGEGTAQMPDNDNYRPGEIPLAFFAPLLQTEADGTLTYTYSVPEANTTWVMKALAYTPDMLTSTIERTTTASRPLMVQITAPRFLRYGDTVTLRATVMNNSPEGVSAKSIISILDADNMQSLATETINSNVNGRESSVISLAFTAPSTGQAVILRVKSTAGEYTDGEQVLIPLLPATQPVITSRSFFVPASSTEAKFTLQGFGEGGSTTFYMYDNPLWEVITALPALNDDDLITSTGAMNVIYMASVARGIMVKHPSLKEALAACLNSDRDESELTSMLQRNDELKQLTLNATPWVRDAMTDKERLISLALLLDDKHIDKIIGKAVKVLDNCRLNDGGLSWCQDGQFASRWSTYRVLTLAASLLQRGFMPENSKLNTIINSAVAYIDENVAERLKKEKHPGDFTQYAYIRSILKDVNKAKLSSHAIQLTINDILKRWKKESTTAKGVDAIILYYNGYPSMARQLVSSIKSFAMTSPEKGTWWDGLDTDLVAGLLYTIETVTPSDNELIQSVAQWLLMNKTNQAWNNAAATSATIDALLGAIDVNKALDGSATANINGLLVENSITTFPGMTVTQLHEQRDNYTVEINKSTGLPVMGSIINRAILPMSDIKATSHPSIVIEKRYNVIKGSNAEVQDTMTVGDRVKIQLVITVKDDLDYVTIIDRRAACMEPVEQLSGYKANDGLLYYREMKDSETRYFIENLNRGTYVIDTEMNVISEGVFSSGVATLQSQINPGITANSYSTSITVNYQ